MFCTIIGEPNNPNHGVTVKEFMCIHSLYWCKCEEETLYQSPNIWFCIRKAHAHQFLDYVLTQAS